MLFACLYIPDFPVQAALRNTDCDLSKQPAAILDGPESLLKVVAVNEAARRCGIDRGMTRLQAETCLGIVLRKRSSVQEESAQAALLDCGYGFSPRVESTTPGTVIVDLGESLVYQRSRAPFCSVDDLALRVPELSKANLAMLARVGALNNISPEAKMHRRDALWQVEKAGRRVGPLLQNIAEADSRSPLFMMDDDERLVADYHGTGLTTGPHPMAYRRKELRSMGIKSAAELRTVPHGKKATVAGSVITRQRPGTASGLIFMTLEDETGHANVIVMPDFYENNRAAVLYERFVFVSGVVQNQDNIVHLRAQRIGPLSVSAAEVQSHDFH